jgi:spermidine/putrescine transport system substrate-binding protein
MRFVRSRSMAMSVSVALVLTACSASATSTPAVPTIAPTDAPTATAAPIPTGGEPTPTSEATPTSEPTAVPTAQPTSSPSVGPTEDPASVTGHLTVLDWAGYDAEDFWIDFAGMYPQVQVDFEIGASDIDIYTKMAAGDQADLFHSYTGYLQFFVDDGLVEEIDTSKLTNWDAVPDSFKAIGQIDGKQYFLPWDWGFTSVLYRTDKVDGEIDSWAALLDPTYSGHISMWDDGPGAVTVSSYIHGYDETAITPEQLEAIKQEWIAQKEHNLFYWAGEPDLVAGVESGDVWVAYSWQGAYATLLGAGEPVAYAQPVEGRNSWVGLYGIRAGSPNVDLAHRFLDAKLAEATGNNVVNLFYYGHTNQAVMAGITDPTLVEAFSIDDPTILEQTNFTPDLTAEQRDAWGQMWTEVKAAP